MVNLSNIYTSSIFCNTCLDIAEQNLPYEMLDEQVKDLALMAGHLFPLHKCKGDMDVVCCCACQFKNEIR